jgi:hypothetical protein
MKKNKTVFFSLSLSGKKPQIPAEMLPSLGLPGEFGAPGFPAVMPG